MSEGAQINVQDRPKRTFVSRLRLTLLIVTVVSWYVGFVAYRWYKKRRDVPNQEDGQDEELDEVLGLLHSRSLINVATNFVVENFVKLVTALAVALIFNVFMIFWFIGSLSRQEIVSVRAMKVPATREEVFFKAVQDTSSYPNWLQDIITVEDDASSHASWMYVDKRGRRFEVVTTKNDPPKLQSRTVKCCSSPLPWILGLIHTHPTSIYIFEVSESPTSGGKYCCIFITRLLRCNSPIIRFLIGFEPASAPIEKLLKSLANEFKIEKPKIVRPQNGKFNFDD